MIKPAYSVSFLLSINIFVWQNVLYFPNDLCTFTSGINGQGHKLRSVSLINSQSHSGFQVSVPAEETFFLIKMLNFRANHFQMSNLLSMPTTSGVQEFSGEIWATA